MLNNCGKLSLGSAPVFSYLGRHIKLIISPAFADKWTMKIRVLVILFTFVVTSIAYAGNKDCEGMNHPAYQDEYRACLRTNIAASAGEAGVDCIDCLFQKESDSNSLVQALAVVAQPVAYLAATYVSAKYANKTQEAWANAYASGFTQCTNRFNSYLNYNTTVGANPLTASDAASLNASCNGYGYGSYAGYGGMTGNAFGGYGNPFLANGYSNGFLNAYGGSYYPYGASSIYNNGMMSGGVGISAWGSIGTGTSSSLYQTGITPAFGF